MKVKATKEVEASVSASKEEQGKARSCELRGKELNKRRQEQEYLCKFEAR